MSLTGVCCRRSRERGDVGCDGGEDFPSEGLKERPGGERQDHRGTDQHSGHHLRAKNGAADHRLLQLQVITSCL